MITSIIAQDIEFLNKAGENKSKYFRDLKSFTRKRTLDYQTVAMNIINLPRRTMAVELEDYFERLDLSSGRTISKSAFSYARQKLQPLFFKDWYEHQNESFYNSWDFRRWKGHRLIAIDGSRAYLFANEKVKAKYGTQKNQHGEIAMAQLLIGHDVLNDLCVFSDIAPIKQSETAMLLPWLDNIAEDMLCIYDRLFPSVFLIYLHLAKKIPFVMRCKLGFNKVIKDFVASNETDKMVAFELHEKAVKSLKSLGYQVQSGQQVSFRAVKVILDNGQTEVLLTSLFDQNQYPTECFKGLYAQRWGVETGIGRLKGQLQLEVFSGRSPLAIQQDFYATIFTYNLQSIFIRSLDEQVEQINQHRKHRYQVNRNVTLGILKGRMIRLFINPQESLIEQLQLKFIQHLTEDKKLQNFKNPRKKKAQRLNGKYRTFTNYKRAI